MTSGISNIVIRKATTDDLGAIKALADQHKKELGFVRRGALAEAIKRSEVIIAQNGQEIIGFVEYYHRKDSQTTLYHIAVASEFRLQGVGRSLMAELYREAKSKNKKIIRIKCPQKLPANQFYEEIGCKPAGQEESKGKVLVVWKLVVELI